MKKIVILLIFCLVVGCSSGEDAPKADFTLEELEQTNNIDAVFAKYNSVRTTSIFYDFNYPGAETANFSETTVLVKGSNGITAYVENSFGYAYAIEKDNVYFQNPDGAYGLYAFFDDGYFEGYYLPYITEWVMYASSEAEYFISDITADGVRVITTHIDTGKNPEEAEIWNFEAGAVIEIIYELDPQSGLIQNITTFTLKDGNQDKILMTGSVVYGQDDDYIPPEFVGLCKDMTDTRTVRFIRGDETFTFTIPAQAVLYPLTTEDYEFFTDPEHTVPFIANEDYSDGITVYMKQIT